MAVILVADFNKYRPIIGTFIKFGLLFLSQNIHNSHCFQDNKNNVTNSTDAYDIGCLDVSDLANGNYTILENNNQLEVQFTCLPGFKLVGESNAICTDGEGLNKPKPQCVQVGCPEPPMLSNGELRVEGFLEGYLYPEGVVAEYKCIAGYHLEPAVHHRVCHKGRWTAQNPSCRADGCSRPEPLVNGHFVPDSGVSRFPMGTRLTFTCDIGYQLKGMDSVLCMASGFWSHTSPQCLRLIRDEGMMCSAPPLGPHVVATTVRGLQGTNSALSGTTLEATCAPGYRDLVSPCIPAILRCIDGNWQGRFANCVAVDSCVYPMNIPHATVLKEGLQSTTYSIGSQVAYSCLPDYQLEGDAVFTCRADGCWDPAVLPVCHPRQPSNIYMNSGEWSDYIKLNASLLVSMVTVACVSVVLLSVCVVLMCRPHPNPAPLAQPPADPDRVALIAFADGVQSVLPTYDEAVRGGVMNCRLHRPHWTTMLGGQRRNNRHPPSMRDSMGSTDTVTVSEVSTNVTVDTVSSHSGSQTASCHAICGSLASFDTSSIINTDGVPLLEVNEQEEISNTTSNGVAADPDLKIQADITSLHS